MVSKSSDHAGLQLGFHGGERNRAFLGVGFLGGELRLDIGEFGFRRGAVGSHFGTAPGLGGRLGWSRRGGLGCGLLKPAAAIGGVEVDDVAQQHLAFDSVRRASR